MNRKPQKPGAKQACPGEPRHRVHTQRQAEPRLGLGNQTLQCRGRRMSLCKQPGNPQQLCTAFEANESMLGGLGNPDEVSTALREAKIMKQGSPRRRIASEPRSKAEWLQLAQEIGNNFWLKLPFALTLGLLSKLIQTLTAACKEALLHRNAKDRPSSQEVSS